MNLQKRGKLVEQMLNAGKHAPLPPRYQTCTSYPGQTGDFLQQIDIIYNTDYVL